MAEPSAHIPTHRRICRASLDVLDSPSAARRDCGPGGGPSHGFRHPLCASMSVLSGAVDDPEFLPDPCLFCADLVVDEHVRSWTLSAPAHSRFWKSRSAFSRTRRLDESSSAPYRRFGAPRPPGVPRTLLLLVRKNSQRPHLRAEVPNRGPGSGRRTSRKTERAYQARLFLAFPKATEHGAKVT